jgi:hypothetical protein
MTRLDLLRISLLASLTACGPSRLATDGATSNDSDSDPGPDSDSGTTTTNSETGTDTGGGLDACAAGCEGATMIADGYARCPDGTTNRMHPAPAVPPLEMGDCHGTEDDLICTSDADCVDGEMGKCVHHDNAPGDLPYSTCYCQYECTSGADCDPGSVCLPAGMVPGYYDYPICVPAACTQNSDCGECGECALGRRHDGCQVSVSFACRHANDECRTNDDCMGEQCVPRVPEPWSCVGSGCVPGRALQIDRAPRTAAPQRRSDWTARASVAGDDRLAARWANTAAFEHASVASFARFGLQLLALGAPPALLRQTSRAAVDEVEHARLAYGLASAYGGELLGPGPLDLRGLELDGDWRDVVRDLIEEACVGETLNVAQALEEAVHADPEVRVTLERIATDELRHAHLAWQSLAWLLRDASAPDRVWALSTLEHAIARVGDASDDLRRETARQVLAPVARALELTIDSPVS